MKPILAVAALPLLLGGCLPLPISIVSTALSGISYMASGKSTSDHLLSATVEKDCALTRPIFGDPVCREIGPNGEGATVSVVEAYYPGDQDDWSQLERAALNTGALDLDKVDHGPAQIAIFLPFANTAPTIKADGVTVTSGVVRPSPDTRRLPVAFSSGDWQPPSRAGGVAIAPLQKLEIIAQERDVRGHDVRAEALFAESGRYVIIGSFRDIARAEVLAGRHGAQLPKILAATVEGRDWYRVAMGPFTASEALLIKRGLGPVDGVIPWTIQLHTPTLLAQL
ncbi:MAG: SPOR domain-containing protein [Alphaproteobacteria bacterium]|nr:SPOR domain-containing protein [Alphaproteobacteria bacterium]